MAKTATVTISGTIIKLMQEKGFGFIKGATGEEYFFHSSACQDAPFSTLATGDRVLFEPKMGEKGPRAESVSVA